MTEKAIKFAQINDQFKVYAGSVTNNENGEPRGRYWLENGQYYDLSPLDMEYLVPLGYPKWNLGESAPVQIETPREKIDAILHNVNIVEISEGVSIAYGTIEADTKKRFRDGEYIRTSKITARYKNILKTRNTVYYIASKHGDRVVQ